MSESRRGTAPDAEAYLKLIGGRVRIGRVRKGLSRKALSQASSVSERFLADLEHGTANVSVLVLRDIGKALAISPVQLVSEEADRTPDVTGAAEENGDLAEVHAAVAGQPGLRLIAPRIALVGLRGAGKTAAGETAALRLGIPFVELDHQIERASGRLLADLLAEHGPATYRQIEQECLERLLENYNRVLIAAGGGLVTAPESFDQLLSSTFVIWLKASPEQHLARAVAKGDVRQPGRSRRALLNELRLVLDDRTPLYRKAHAVVDTTARKLDEVVDAIVALVAQQPAESAT